MTNCHRRGIGNIQDGLHRVFKDLKILENGHLFGIYGVEMTCYYYCLVKYTMKNSFLKVLTIIQDGRRSKIEYFMTSHIIC